MKIPGFENWGLKLLALILAIVIYNTLKNDNRDISQHEIRTLKTK